jgi:hypothetical protein
MVRNLNCSATGCNCDGARSNSLPTGAAMPRIAIGGYLGGAFGPGFPDAAWQPAATIVEADGRPALSRTAVPGGGLCSLSKVSNAPASCNGKFRVHPAEG